MVTENSTSSKNFNDDPDYRAFIVYKSDIEEDIHPVCTAYLRMHAAYLDMYKSKTTIPVKTDDAYRDLSKELHNYEKNTKILQTLTSEQEMDIGKIAYSHFETKEDAHDFIHMYKELFKLEKDQNNLVNAKPTSETFMAKLNIQKPRLGCIKHDLSAPYMYAVSWPRKVIAVWLSLEHHPKVLANPKSKDPLYLRGLTKELMTRYLDGLTCLPVKLQQTSLLYLIALSFGPNIIEAGQSYRSDFKPTTDDSIYTKSIPLFMLFSILDNMVVTNDPKYKSLLDAIQKLQTNPATRHLKYISLSTDAQKEDLEKEYAFRKYSSKLTNVPNTYLPDSPLLN